VTDRIRAIWRAAFRQEPPPRIDGYIISLRMRLSGVPWSLEEWQRQLLIREAENLARELAWARGRRFS
jgi:hypothetical protein